MAAIGVAVLLMFFVSDASLRVGTGEDYNVSHLAAFNQTWAPLQVLYDKAVFFTPMRAVVDTSDKCKSQLSFPYAFHLQDIMTVGHMHRTFASFFSYLCTVPQKGAVAAIWGESLQSSIHSSSSVLNLVYKPMLRMFQRHFRKRQGLHIQAFEVLNGSKCLRVQQLGQRQCTLKEVPPLVAGTTGNCGNWFANAEVVAFWRTMLVSEAGLKFPLHNLLRLPHRSPWSVLVYNRPGPRQFEKPEHIRWETLTFLRSQMPTASFIVQLHTFLEPDFLAQCHLFNSYDLIILTAASLLLRCTSTCPLLLLISRTPSTLST
eukprot:GGOE01010504.1.p1 GENE.GGOE01010504.1~~GGOE01010504.1.p1  ORF type:complete len:317 (+),score=72.65 GGOE01010504.1:66-1016(+)